MNKPTKELQLEHYFGTICRRSDGIDAAFAIVTKTRGLPKGLAFYFYQSYSRAGFFDLRKAFELMYYKLRSHG